jgi:hypothetical protein
MSLRRHQPRFASPTPDITPERQRLSTLESSIRAIRPTRAPSEPPAPLPAERSNRLVLVLVEIALQHMALGDRDEARRSIADALLVLEQVNDEPTIARASLVLGEALLALDLPRHAEPRFVRAADIYERFGDQRSALRAKVGLGQTLVALDDEVGCAVLRTAREKCGGDPAILAHIDAALKAAEKIFDTPRTVHTGYGRPVSIPPPRPRR